MLSQRLLPPSPFHSLGFPCNGFGGQDPGSEATIENFTCTRYKTTVRQCALAGLRLRAGRAHARLVPPHRTSARLPAIARPCALRHCVLLHASLHACPPTVRFLAVPAHKEGRSEWRQGAPAVDVDEDAKGGVPRLLWHQMGAYLSSLQGGRRVVVSVAVICYTSGGSVSAFELTPSLLTELHQVPHRQKRRGLGTLCAHHAARGHRKRH